MNEFRVLNGKGDIEVKILKPANAVFQTDEFHVDSTVTVYKNAFNIFDLVFENQQLKERIEYLERSNDRREDTILEQRQEISNLEDNWNKLREWIVYNKHNENTEQHYLVVDYGTLLGKMQELEQGSDSNVKD
jgi:hypothetical protein